MSVSLTPAFSKKSSDAITITSVKLIDITQANGKKPLLEWTAIMDGNLVNHAKSLGGNSKGSGVMIVNDETGWVYTIGVHTYNNCVNSDCGNYVIHGHRSKLEASAFCVDNGFSVRSIPDQTSDFSRGKMNYIVGKDQTEISLVGINATEKLIPSYQPLCNKDYVGNVGTAYLYETRYFANVETICVKLSQDTPISSISKNGFTTKKTPEICPDS